MAQSIDWTVLSHPTARLQLNDASMELAQPGMRNDAYMEDISAPSSHDEGPTKGSGMSGLFSGMKPKAKTTKDGLPAKKRGPKRDSKPAQNRRQELNRQAQRTHRERKEMYTKGLEVEVNRLKEVYSQLAKDSNPIKGRTTGGEVAALRRENESLKQLLQLHNISYEHLLSGTNGVHTPIQNVGLTSAMDVPPMQRQVSPPMGQFPRHDQSQIIDFNAMPYQRMPSVSSESTQTMLQPNPNIDISASHTPMQSFASEGGSPSSIGSSSQGGFSYQSQGSTNGTSFIPSAMTPNSNSNTQRSSPVYPAHQHLQREESDTIDAVITESTATNFRPPLGQGLVNGKVVRNTSDERIKQQSMDHDQLAVDFILALEQSCREHQQHCSNRALPTEENEANLELSGHAMMLSNPPQSRMVNDTKTPWPFQPPDIPIGNLLVLMDTAQKIPMRSGEITPILALKKIREDGRYGLMTPRLWQLLTKRLMERTRCYGFGSVLEEFKVDDELDKVFADLGSAPNEPPQQGSHIGMNWQHPHAHQHPPQHQHQYQHPQVDVRY